MYILGSQGTTLALASPPLWALAHATQPPLLLKRGRRHPGEALTICVFIIAISTSAASHPLKPFPQHLPDPSERSGRKRAHRAARCNLGWHWTLALFHGTRRPWQSLVLLATSNDLQQVLAPPVPSPPKERSNGWKRPTHPSFRGAPDTRPWSSPPPKKRSRWRREGLFIEENPRGLPRPLLGRKEGEGKTSSFLLLVAMASNLLAMAST